MGWASTVNGIPRRANDNRRRTFMDTWWLAKTRWEVPYFNQPHFTWPAMRDSPFYEAC